jgi:hypothetical protein
MEIIMRLVAKNAIRGDDHINLNAIELSLK